MGCDEVDESVRGYSVKEVGSSDNECRYGLQSGGRPETALIYTLVIACPDFGNRMPRFCLPDTSGAKNSMDTYVSLLIAILQLFVALCKKPVFQKL